MNKPSDPLPPVVQAALQRGQPIEAIRLLILDRLRKAGARDSAPQVPMPAAATRRRRLPARDGQATPPGDGLSPGEVPRSASSVWLWVVVALAVYVAVRWFRG